MTRTELIEVVYDTILNNSTLCREEILLGETWYDQGIDSLEKVSTILDIEHRFRIEIPDSDADELRTPLELVDYLSNVLRIN